MTFTLAHRIQNIKPSTTLAVAARAAQLKAAGQDIINLGVGEPDFDTPEHIKKAAIRAIDNGYTKYTPVDGIHSLKKAIQDKFERDNQLNYAINQIMVTNGCKQGIYNLMQALLESGDEVIIPAPYWVSYPEMVLLADAKPVIVSTTFEQRYKLMPSQLEKAITPKTKLVILNSPSNPSGIAYTRKELEALAQVLLKYPHILIASDDIYEHTLWSAESFTNIVMVCPELSERVIIHNGVSKTYAMTGWRIGYAAGPAQLISAMTNIQSQSTSNPNSIAQYAAYAAISGDQTCVKQMVNAFQRRHDILITALQKIPGIKFHNSDGTFYSFIDVQQILSAKNITNDVAFAEYLLTESGIALVPGSAFGTPGCIRLSFAISDEQLIEALRRLAVALA